MRYDPFRHADRLKIPVEYGDTGDDDGRWYPRRRLIVLRPGMPAMRERCVLAHELGHVCLGHRETTARNELAADRFAARNLIAPDDLLDAMRWSDDPGEWCRLLDVTPHTLEVYATISTWRAA